MMMTRVFRIVAALHLLLVSPHPVLATSPEVQATDSPKHEAVGCAPARALDDLDRRTPVVLLPMMAQHQKEQMRDHLVAIQEIIEGASRESWTAVDAAAARVGYSDSMAAMCEHMGAATPGFTEMALQFHQRADRIREAARAESLEDVLEATAATLSACTACHATYKQKIVGEDEWHGLTGSDAPAPGLH